MEFDLNDPEQRQLAQDKIHAEQLKELSNSFSSREEMMEQLIISKESGVSYQYLDEMDALLYETDFRHAYIFMQAVYQKARVDAEKEGKRKRHYAPPSHNNAGGSENIIDLEKELTRS